MRPQLAFEEMKGGIEAAYKRFATRVSVRRPGLEWNLESHPARNSDWVLVLWFSAARAPLDELVDITGTLNRSGRRFKIDITGRDAAVLDEVAFAIDVDESGAPLSIDESVASYLESLMPMVLAELTVEK